MSREPTMNNVCRAVYLLLLLCASLFAGGCAPSKPAFVPSRTAFFDPLLLEDLELGNATPELVRQRLGEPYLETQQGPDRVLWVYDFNPTRQAVLYFGSGVLVEKGWTLSYPNPIDPEWIFRARPELRGLQGE